MVSICRFRSATRARDRGLHRGVILAAPPRRHSREPEPARLSVLTPSPYRRVLDGKPDLSEQHDNPATTGLPMTVRVSPRGAARHDVRIKVNVTHGNRMRIANTAIVAVGPVPRVVTGQLSPTDAQLVFAWVTLNENALAAYWLSRVDTAALVQRLRRV